VVPEPGAGYRLVHRGYAEKMSIHRLADKLSITTLQEVLASFVCA
jgi:hypothetical protein